MIASIILILITLGLVVFLAFGSNDTASSGLFFVQAEVETKPCANPKFERIDGKCREPCRNGRDPITKNCIRKPKTPAVGAQPPADKPAVTQSPVKPGGGTALTVDQIRILCKKAGGYMPKGATTCDMTKTPDGKPLTGGTTLTVDQIREECRKVGGYMPKGATTCDMTKTPDGKPLTGGKPPTTGLSNNPAVTFDGKTPTVPDKNGNCPPGMNNSGGRGMCVANRPTVSNSCPAGQMPLMVGGQTVCTCPPGWTMTNGVCTQQPGDGGTSVEQEVVEEEARKRKRVIKLF